MKQEVCRLPVGFCLQCGNLILGVPSTLVGSDPEALTRRLTRCKNCRGKHVHYLRVPRVPRYQCHYLSTGGDELRSPFSLTPENIHLFVTAETYEMFFRDAWNGFKAVSKAKDIPPLYEISVPHGHNRQWFAADAVLVIASYVASGIIGGIAYDALKDQARKLWDRLSRKDRHHVTPLVKEAPVRYGNEFDRVFESSFVYLTRRLRGLKALSVPSGPLFRAARYLAKNPAVTSQELARHLNCSLDDAKFVLKMLGAEYSLSTKKWHLSRRLQDYYRGRTVDGSSAEGDAEPFFARGRPTREVAYSLDIPTPPGLSDNEEMDFEVATLQATTPDTEAFLRGQISDKELQQRVYVKAGALEPIPVGPLTGG
jgi:hypothetical protein